jgi:NitT/TauT family transport system permease protein
MESPQPLDARTPSPDPRAYCPDLAGHRRVRRQSDIAADLFRNRGRVPGALVQDRPLEAAVASLLVLLKGYFTAVALALLLVSAVVANSFAREVVQTLAAMFSPLPAIALLPIAMLWFGLGEGRLLRVLVYSLIWPFALAALAGFESVPETQRLVGRNYGLRGLRHVVHILIPGALAPILAGLQVG